MPTWPLTALEGWKIFQRKITKKVYFPLPLHDSPPPGTIMYHDEKFLCKNALKVKFTLPFWPLEDPLETLEKKFRRQTLKNEVFRKSIWPPPQTPPLTPLGCPTVPIYAFGCFERVYSSPLESFCLICFSNFFKVFSEDNSLWKFVEFLKILLSF